MIGEHIAAFLAHPFDPNNDGKTSALEWFAFLGLLAVLAFIWSKLLSYLLE
jgi:cyanate permease